MSDRSPLFAVDHVVVAASSLEAGAAWCEAALGVAPEPGGRHPSMATHNLLLDVSSPRFGKAYLEIIAIDPAADPAVRARWFDLDAPEIRDAIAGQPRLVHWVARTPAIDAAAQALRAAGYDPGNVVSAERMTPRGALRWKILLRDDGRRLAAGAVPLVIEWAGEHPADSLPASGVSLERVELGDVAPGLVATLGVSAGAGSASLAVRLTTSQGSVVLEAPAPMAAPDR